MNLLEIITSKYAIAIGALVIATVLAVSFTSIYSQKSPEEILKSEKIIRVNGELAHVFDSKECKCTLEYNPVCGGDGNTYFNQCFAQCAGKTVATFAACGGSQAICTPGRSGDTCSVNQPCEDGLICHLGTCRTPEGYICANGRIVNLPTLCPVQNDIVPNCQPGGEVVCTIEGERYLNNCYALAAGVQTSYITQCQTQCSTAGQACGGPLYGYPGNPSTAYYSPTACCNGLSCNGGTCNPLPVCQSQCSDTDNSNTMTKGTITNTTGTFTDTCALDSQSEVSGYLDLTSGPFVKEYTCPGVATYSQCESRRCVDGACLPVNAEFCSENDYGNSPAIQGKTNGRFQTVSDGWQNGTWTDRCSGTGYQEEFYCQNPQSDVVLRALIPCSAGSTCNEATGICNSCTDTDGTTFTTKGSITNSTGTFTDTCTITSQSDPSGYYGEASVGNAVKEYTCSGMIYHDCNCVDGACSP